jgi:putative oxidoreductase
VLKRFLFLKQIPLSPNFARLALRVVFFGSLFVKHGAEKLFSFGAMQQTFVAHNLDPLHIGAIPSLLIATMADGICSLLLVFGLFTRWAALFLFGNIFVAWALVHHFQFLGPNTDHGEMIVLYLGGCIALFFSGAGKFSLDALFDRTGSDVEQSSDDVLAARV